MQTDGLYSAPLKRVAPAEYFDSPSDLPTLEVSSGLEYMIFRAEDAVLQSLKFVQGSRDPKPFLLTNFLVSSIPDVAWRKRTLKTMNDLRVERGYDDIGVDGVHLLCTEVVGCVTDWQTKYRGAVKNLVVGGV